MCSIHFENINKLSAQGIKHNDLDIPGLDMAKFCDDFNKTLPTLANKRAILTRMTLRPQKARQFDQNTRVSVLLATELSYTWLITEHLVILESFNSLEIIEGCTKNFEE